MLTNIHYDILTNNSCKHVGTQLSGKIGKNKLVNVLIKFLVITIFYIKILILY